MGDFMVSSGVVHLNANAGGLFLLLFFAVSGLSCCIYLVGLQFCINTYHELRYAFVIVLKQLFENTLAVKTTLKLNTKSK